MACGTIPKRYIFPPWFLPTTRNLHQPCLPIPILWDVPVCSCKEDEGFLKLGSSIPLKNWQDTLSSITRMESDRGFISLPRQIIRSLAEFCLTILGEISP